MFADFYQVSFHLLIVTRAVRWGNDKTRVESGAPVMRY